MAVFSRNDMVRRLGVLLFVVAPRGSATLAL